MDEVIRELMYIEEKNPDRDIFSNNTKGIKKKEAFARRLGRSDQMTSRRDDVMEVKNESMQKEGHFPTESKAVEGDPVRKIVESILWI